MRYIFYIALITLTTLNCKAQIVSEVNETIIALEDERNDFVIKTLPYYAKDVNNILDKFIGTWTGTYNNRNYTFIISDKLTRTDNGVKQDYLLMRHKITDSSGNVLEDTTTLPDDNELGLVISGLYIDTTGHTYHLNYFGKRLDCGHSGEIFISVGHNNNPNLMQLYIVVDGEGFSRARCPDYENYPILLPKHTDPQALFIRQ